MVVKVAAANGLPFAKLSDKIAKAAGMLIRANPSSDRWPLVSE